jgi:hypothetical protein
MLENRFPRIRVPDAENRDLRQLLWHRHRLVQMRMRVMNQLRMPVTTNPVRSRTGAGKTAKKRCANRQGLVKPKPGHACTG